MSNLKVYFNSTDISLKTRDYLDGSYDFTFTASDKIYVGYRKPINAIYLQLNTPDTNGVNISVKYYNGTAFTDISTLEDETYNLSESGFIRWDRNIDDEASTTINTYDLYWYEITTDVDTSALVLSGLNLVFNNDKSMISREPQLSNGKYYPTGQSSFIGYIQSSRDKMIQKLRNQGKAVNFNKNGDLNIFDLGDYTQLEEASTLFSLSMVYFNKSDDVVDKYFQKYENYKSEAEEAFRTYYLSLDKDDNGKEDGAEKAAFQTKLIKRI